MKGNEKLRDGNREKGKLLAQAEEADNKRVESDLAIQTQRWEQEQRTLLAEAEATKFKSDLENILLEEKVLKEKQHLEQTVGPRKDIARRKGAERKATPRADMRVGIGREGKSRGRLLLRLQRQLPVSMLHFGFTGVICLHKEGNGKLSILEGQHRVGMMKILQEKQQEQQEHHFSMNDAMAVSDYIDVDNILVEVYHRPHSHSQHRSRSRYILGN